MISLLAQAIAEVNKDKQAYVMHVTSGEHEGKFIGRNHNLVKTKRAALKLVCNNPDTWQYSFPHWHITANQLEIIEA